MFTVRNVFNSYKSQLLSYYVFEQIISSKTTLRICDIFLMKNSMVFYEQVCVRNRIMKEIAANGGLPQPPHSDNVTSRLYLYPAC